MATPAIARLIEDYCYWRPPSLERQANIDDAMREVERLEALVPASSTTPATFSAARAPEILAPAGKAHHY